MNPRPLTALALIVSATVVTLAVPAGAAVPKAPASMTVPCNDGSAKSAQLWSAGHKLAATNPCIGWLAIPWGGFYGSSAPENAFDLAPGAHFNWSKTETLQRLGAGVPTPKWASIIPTAYGPPCDNGGSPTWVQLIYSYKDVRQEPEC